MKLTSVVSGIPLWIPMRTRHLVSTGAGDGADEVIDGGQACWRKEHKGEYCSECSVQIEVTPKPVKESGIG